MKSCKTPQAVDSGAADRARRKFFNRGKPHSKRLRISGGVAMILAVLGFCSPAFAFEVSDVLHAIHQVENPTNSLRAGRYGELGPYQFRPNVWHSYTDKPFSLATDHEEAGVVARQHYEWIVRGLERNGLDVSPYHIALAWNAGLSATINGRASASARHYATRVSNLVESGLGGSAVVAR